MRAAFIFYRGLAIPAILITLFCCAGATISAMDQVRQHALYNGVFMFIAPLFWIKTVTTIILIFYMGWFRANERYFYHNLGIGINALRGTVLIVDYLLFFLAISLTEMIIPLLIMAR
ncbi:MAG: hypothetical protein WCO44_01825 [Bacteroidota bacterium]